MSAVTIQTCAPARQAGGGRGNPVAQNVGKTSPHGRGFFLSAPRAGSALIIMGTPWPELSRNAANPTSDQLSGLTAVYASRTIGRRIKVTTLGYGQPRLRSRRRSPRNGPWSQPYPARQPLPWSLAESSSSRMTMAWFGRWTPRMESQNERATPAAPFSSHRPFGKVACTWDRPMATSMRSRPQWDDCCGNSAPPPPTAGSPFSGSSVRRGRWRVV